MIELVQANWLLFVAALLIGIAIAYWIFVASRRTRVETDGSDALTEGAAPAARNQALIDAAPATVIGSAPTTAAPPLQPAIPPAVPAGLSGAGTAVAAAAAQQNAQVLEEQASNPVTQEDIPAAPNAPASAPASQSGDDLGRIKGVGPKLQALLATLGVDSFARIAAWSDAEIDRIDAQLGRFAGRIRRDNWVEQARLLAGGDTAGYEDKFGKL
ncbi:hypothetical protein GRI44_07840 [Altererythrobacter confluentis]|uniref:Uncharacterized protein n=1 Tax=Allopontixanthobacter confluentis TaxID=1849021 RepID=A0A6L7GGC8_9SPHN|nr:hypothetical protein [Allopontixanthobacter confluentis]MXP14660.1 hypothetical protein [Allopontixanthobacter confluentis]